MKAEIIAVGTELLLGQIVNTNAQTLSVKLAELGIDVYFQSVVGDNPGRLREAIEIGRKRADLLVFTGGLGPTQDDLTKEVLAQYLNRSLIIHEPSMDKIKALFSERGTHMVESNRKQAIMLEASEPLHNNAGLAVGVGVVQDGTAYLLLPGPPRELKAMLASSADQWLRQQIGNVKPLYSRILKFAGIGESNLEDQLLDLIEQQQETTLAPYAKEGEVALRVSVKAESEAIAEQKINAAVIQIKERVGHHLYAEQDIPIEVTIHQLLRSSRRTLASAESCTGGLFAELITSVPGSSGEFKGGVVTYTNEMKHQLLGIPLSMLEGDGAAGAVSEQTARLMADNMRQIANTDFAVSFTGVAGPGTAEGKPVGLVYIALAQREKDTAVYELKLGGDREMIRLRAVKAAQYRLWQALTQ
ncbi:competence/damage-inducible protein A [Paenibacillus yanchengensis]|uniref:Putative competence-damage inducible protein n=1 Tax=Paenibacillus yanchengensis TaxID=2035833 RepID=A0ABW4YMQ8_9BACL